MAPKTVAALDEPANGEKVTARQRMLGAFCLSTFVTTWVLSAASPFLFGWSLLHERYVVASLIGVITLISYLPWEKGFLANSFHGFLSHYVPKYFNSLKILFESDKLPGPSDPQYLYAVHPHGAFCIGWACIFLQLQHVRFCFSPALFASPFFRLFSRSSGRPGSASKFSMVSYMRNGESLALPPGGFEEATLTSLQKDRVFIRKRTGFIRLALQHGIAVRPVYVFGEKKCYWNIQGLFSSRLVVNRYGIPAIVTWGHPLFPLLPKPSVDLCIVVGAPLVLPKIEKPTKEDVKRWHDKYVAALVKLFEDHKEDAYGPEDGKVAKLEVW